MLFLSRPYRNQTRTERALRTRHHRLTFERLEDRYLLSAPALPFATYDPLLVDAATTDSQSSALHAVDVPVTDATLPGQQTVTSATSSDGLAAADTQSSAASHRRKHFSDAKTTPIKPLPTASLTVTALSANPGRSLTNNTSSTPAPPLEQANQPANPMDPSTPNSDANASGNNPNQGMSSSIVGVESPSPPNAANSVNRLGNEGSLPSRPSVPGVHPVINKPRAPESEAFFPGTANLLSSPGTLSKGPLTLSIVEVAHRMPGSSNQALHGTRGQLSRLGGTGSGTAVLLANLLTSSLRIETQSAPPQQITAHGMGVLFTGDPPSFGSPGPDWLSPNGQEPLLAPPPRVPVDPGSTSATAPFQGPAPLTTPVSTGSTLGDRERSPQPSMAGNGTNDLASERRTWLAGRAAEPMDNAYLGTTLPPLSSATLLLQVATASPSAATMRFQDVDLRQRVSAANLSPVAWEAITKTASSMPDPAQVPLRRAMPEPSHSILVSWSSLPSCGNEGSPLGYDAVVTPGPLVSNAVMVGGTAVCLACEESSAWTILTTYALVILPRYRKYQPTILLVDPDDTTREALNIALVREGYFVLPAANVRDAWGMFRMPQVTIDLVLLDPHLPDVSGIHLCTRLRELDPALPVMVCAGDVEPAEVAQLRQLGVRYYLRKPIAFDELLHTVKAILP